MCWLLCDGSYDAEREVDKWKRRLSDGLMNIQQDMDFHLPHSSPPTASLGRVPRASLKPPEYSLKHE